MKPTKLKPKDIKPLREKMLKKQRYMCPLCGHKVRLQDAALDHCHTTGTVRATLHNWCNTGEGKIKHHSRWMRIDKIEALTRLLRYWKKDFSKNPIHPTHKTKIDKQLISLRKRLKAARRCTTKDKLKLEIRNLKVKQERQYGDN